MPDKSAPSNDKNTSKMPVQRPPMGGSKMPPMGMNSKSGKPGNNFSKPARIMRAAKGR